MTRNYLIVLAICAWLPLTTGCSPKIYPEKTASDSLSVIVKDTVIYRDSIIYVKIPDGISTGLVPKDSTSHLETQVAESDAWIESGQLHHTLINKDVMLPAPIKVPKEIHIEAKNHVNVERMIQRVYVEKQLSVWQSFRISLGTISLVCICLYLLIKFGRIAIKTWLKK